ncbi:MAG TPA: cellulose synthase [Ramlibacter sp.]|jgi:hypothetical protein|uniref:cellulose synthase n=1 Tax=Ramlibacter sp. TaxID=1917967 RepID=UPI002D2E6EF6|nr:cellulose synthase [Ramlibacter sp.]HZY18626.1 cellulose synthase [Ramlibacter sp.]
MQTVLEILLVNSKDGTSKKTGQAFSIKEAHCVLRDTAGKAGAVGVLTVPKALEAVAKPGLYTASFTLDAPTYGPDQGKVVATLAGLVPIEAKQLRPMPAGA